MRLLIVGCLRELAEKPCREADVNAIAAYVEGALSQAERHLVEEHMAGCRRCRQAALFAALPPRPPAGEREKIAGPRDLVTVRK